LPATAKYPDTYNIAQKGDIVEGPHCLKITPAEKGPAPQNQTRLKSDRFGLFSLLAGWLFYFALFRFSFKSLSTACSIPPGHRHSSSASVPPRFPQTPRHENSKFGLLI
jgi:hypothetical protein